MRKRKLLATLTVGLGLTLTLAACGGKDKASSADGAGDIKGNTVLIYVNGEHYKININNLIGTQL